VSDRDLRVRTGWPPWAWNAGAPSDAHAVLMEGRELRPSICDHPRATKRWQWRRDGQLVSTQSYCWTSGTGASDFLLELFVEDSARNRSSAWLEVEVSGWDGRIECEF